MGEIRGFAGRYRYERKNGDPWGGEPNPTDRLLVDSREAARLLSISERHLWSLTQVGEIPYVRLGKSKRYDVEALREFINKHTVYGE